jgi:hypothetical protein
VLFSVMYLLLHRLVRLLANSSKDLKGDVKVVVLRHQQMVLSATWPSASSPSRPVGYENLILKRPMLVDESAEDSTPFDPRLGTAQVPSAGPPSRPEPAVPSLDGAGARCNGRCTLAGSARDAAARLPVPAAPWRCLSMV